MQKTALIDKIITAVQTECPKVNSIYLFGSYVSGHQNTKSDVDLAIVTDDTISALELWDHRISLSQTIGKDIDLVDFSSVSTVFQYQILTTGTRIWTCDEHKAERNEDRIYQLYLTLNDDRKYILIDILKRGTVYG